MPFQSAHFAADTDFERTVVSLLGTHRVEPAQPGTVHDRRASAGPGQMIQKLGIAEQGTGRPEQLRRSLRPLGFGAAYKILDQLVEHVHQANGGSQGLLSFATKTAAVPNRPGILPTPFDSNPELWDRLAALYRAFVEARHTVVHRRAPATQTGDLEVHDNQGNHVDTITSNELAAFAAAVHAAAELAIDASDDARRVQIVAWHLNSLQSRHGAPPVPALNATGGRRVLQVDLEPTEGKVRFNVAEAREVVDGQAPALWDLELHSSDGVYEGFWEDVPDKGATEFEFDAATPPPWLTERP